MALDTVPWMIAGGAVHSAEVGRSLAYAATGGKSGITAPRDFLVLALSTPGTSVRVAAGSAAIVNAYAGQEGQSYIARNTSDVNVAIAATVGSARSDMLVLRIDDPQYGGSVPPDGVAIGPYVKLEIIPNVGSTATEVPGGTPYPAIPLARIDIPAGTGTITNAMITSLRSLYRPRTDRQIYTKMGPGAILYLSSTASDGVGFPDATGFDVDIPAWATYVKVVVQSSGMIARTPGTAGFKVGIGSSVDPDNIRGSEVGWDDGVAANAVRSSILAAHSAVVPVGARGTTKNLVLRGRKASGGNIESNASTVIIYDVEFSETPATS